MNAMDRLKSLALEDNPSIEAGLQNFGYMIGTGGFSKLIEAANALMAEESKQPVLRDDLLIAKLIAHIKEQLKPIIEQAFVEIERQQKHEREKRQMVSDIVEMLPKIEQAFEQIRNIDKHLQDIAKPVTGRAHLRFYFSGDEYETLKRLDFVLAALDKSILSEL